MNDAEDFNSHAHVERDRIHTKTIQPYRISTHTLTWSVTNVNKRFSFGGEDFNSHAHVERDRTSGGRVSESQQISTHTLTWSVTINESDRENWKCISTHTLTWSVTGEALKHIVVPKISTHTLTWSVTFCYATHKG